MANILPILLFCVLVFAVSLHLASCVLVIWRFRRVDKSKATKSHAPISVIRPVCSLEPSLEAALASSFTDMTGDYEVIFCIARHDDAAIPTVRQLMAAHPEVPSRLLIGDDRVSGNPKLNNLVKGWNAARYDWIAMIDSNVLLPRDYVQSLFAAWDEDTGLVTSPPVGIRAKGVWARVESAFLNTYQDRWQLASDQLGNGFAQGKVLFWRRDILEVAGGLAALGRDLAEDVASTKVVRAAGLKIRVVQRPFPQPLGRRGFAEVWNRQVRWARVRRAGFPGLFALEPLSCAALPGVLVVGLVLSGALPSLALAGFVILWYGAEVLVARRADWPATVADVPTWLLRDAMIPLIWSASFAAKGFVWRGNPMAPGPAAPSVPS